MRSSVAALDSQRSQIQVGDTVKVVEGLFKDKVGTIKHIYKTTLFLHSTTYNRDSGIFNARARSCLLVGKEKKMAIDPYTGEHSIVKIILPLCYLRLE